MPSSYGTFISRPQPHGDLNFFIDKENKFYWDKLTTYFIIFIEKKGCLGVFFPLNFPHLDILYHTSQNIEPPEKLLIAK